MKAVKAASALKVKFNIIGYDASTYEVPGCRGLVCHVNDGREPPKWIDRPVSEKCSAVENCCTAVIKTAKRLDLCRRLVQSIFQYFPNLKVIVVDDLNPDSNKDRQWQNLLKQKAGALTYIQAPLKEAGISIGRNIGLRNVTTKYFLILDDDYIFSTKTDLKKMLDILERTDITMVGGSVYDIGFSGIFRAFPNYSDPSKDFLIQYRKIAMQILPGFPDCLSVDIMSNFFMGITKEVLDFGAWDDEVIVREHKAFFVAARINRKKIVVCENIHVLHKPKDKVLLNYRLKIAPKYFQIFLNKWNITSATECGKQFFYLPDKCVGDDAIDFTGSGSNK